MPPGGVGLVPRHIGARCAPQPRSVHRGEGARVPDVEHVIPHIAALQRRQLRRRHVDLPPRNAPQSGPPPAHRRLRMLLHWHRTLAPHPAALVHSWTSGTETRKHRFAKHSW